MAASPLCLVNGGSTTNGTNVTAGSLVTITLQSSAGVDLWQLLCVGTDDTLTAAAINASLTVNYVTKVATFIAPSPDPKTIIFQSKVNNGIKNPVDGVVDPNLTTTFGVYVATDNEERVAAVNERTEGSVNYGWVTVLNNALRNGGGGGGGGTIVRTALVATAVVAGDVITSASTLGGTTVTKATTAALALGNLPTGIALTPAIPPLGITTFAGMGDRVPAATIGLGAGTATWGIVNATGRVVRRDPPVIGDIVAGVVDTLGNLLVLPFIWSLNGVQAALAPYKANNDNTADAQPVLQAAIDATYLLPASVGRSDAAKTLKLGEGFYRIDHPLHLHTSGIHMMADGDETMSIQARNYIGPAIWVCPYTDLLPMVANTSGSGGNAAVIKTEINRFLEKFIELRKYGAGLEIHGRNQLEIRFVYKRSAMATNGGSFLASYGGRNSDEPAQGAFSIYMNDSAAGTPFAIQFNLFTTVGGQHVLQTPANSFTLDNLWHEVCCSWDGATARIYIDGVLQAPVGDPAVGGTLIQYDWETTQFGGRCLSSNFGRNPITGNADGLCAWLTIQDIAEHTPALFPAGYTPNFAVKPTWNVNTRWHCDFNNNFGAFVGATSRPFTDSTTHIVTWLPSHNDNYFAGGKLMTAVNFSKMTVFSAYGPALEMDNNNNCLVEKCTFNGKWGLIASNVCYSSTFRDIKCTSTPTNTAPQAGIFLGDSCYYTSTYDIQIIGYRYGWQTLSESFLSGKSYILGNGVGIYSSGGTLNIAGSHGLSDEGWTNVKTHVMLNGIVNANIQGITSVGGTNPQQVSVDNLGFGPGVGGSQSKVSFRSCMFGMNSGAPGCFLVRGGFATAATAFIDVESCTKYDRTALWYHTSTPTAARVTFAHEGRTGRVPLAMTDADYTVSREDWINYAVVFTGTLTAARTVTCPAANTGPRAISNLTGQTLNLKAAGGAVTISLSAGASGIFNSTGTELYLLS